MFFDRSMDFFWIRKYPIVFSTKMTGSFYVQKWSMLRSKNLFLFRQRKCAIKFSKALYANVVPRKEASSYWPHEIIFECIVDNFEQKVISIALENFLCGWWFGFSLVAVRCLQSCQKHGQQQYCTEMTQLCLFQLGSVDITPATKVLQFKNSNN